MALLTVKTLEDLGIQPNDQQYVLVGPVLCCNCGATWVAVRPATQFLVPCIVCGLLRAN